MKQTFAFILSILFLVSCVKVQEANNTEAAGSLDALQTVENENDMAGKDTLIPDQILKGTLTTTKGGQAMVKGVLISSDIFKKILEERGGESEEAKKLSFRSIILEYRDKEVELKGDLNIHICGPMEQCLDGGVIKSLLNIQYIKTL